MKRNQAIDILTTNQARLKEVGVKSLAIFGSVARDEAKENSDVDLLVEFESGKLMKWGDLIAIEHQLETLLGCDVDLVTQEELKPRLRDRILKEALPILSRLQIFKVLRMGSTLRLLK